MNAVNRRAAARLALGFFTASALAGCGGGPPTPAPADQARKTLDSALDSWAAGKTIEAVKAASPSILVEDPKWKQGVALKKFEVREGDGKPSGAERVFSVTLTLADAAGKETTEQVDYRVGTSPILTVFRALF